MPDVPIRLYYHVTMIGAFEEITEKLFRTVRESGLCDVCESISIGALGDESELPKLKSILQQYPKAVVRVHNSNTNIFEFITLKLLYEDALNLPLFYGCYFHSKGVTFLRNGYEGHSRHEEEEGKDYRNWLYEQFWSDMMAHFVITEWRKSYAALDMKEYGYDVTGCRYIPLRKSASDTRHASGNFWWVNSEYAATLPPITEDDFGTEKMFHAEMWVHKAQPLTYIIANPCCGGFHFQNGTFAEWWNKEDNKQQYLSP